MLSIYILSLQSDRTMLIINMQYHHCIKRKKSEKLVKSRTNKPQSVVNPFVLSSLLNPGISPSPIEIVEVNNWSLVSWKAGKDASIGAIVKITFLVLKEGW